MARPNRREFLAALGLVPFAAAATAASAKTPPSPRPSPSPAVTPPEDPLKALREFRVPDGAEPALVFRASRSDGMR